MIHHNLPLRLLLIIIFLSLIALGNIFGIYESIIQQNFSEALNSILSLILYAVPAYGLLQLKPWARTLELILSGFLVVLGLILMAIYSVLIGAFIAITHGLIASYLLTSECKQLFGLCVLGKQKAD